MPFDDRSFPSLEAALDRRRRHRVAAWLFVVSFMIWGMVVLGGATRLTGSGLSIMEWKPLSGALPPLSHAAWQHVFGLYKQIPQYALLHPGMDLAGFRGIFWLEWTHRAWGRLMNVVFLLPLVWFAVTGAIRQVMILRLVSLYALGALQGAVGWFMVSSGFEPASTAVSPYRLVLHLCLALALFAGMLWTAFDLLAPVPPSVPRGRHLRLLARGAATCVGLAILAGGFTAGTHAGLVYDSFPLMDGRLVPAGYADLHPFLRNLTENVAAVQFDHRLLATLAALLALATVVTGLLPATRARLPEPARVALACLGALVLTQYGLGVATLLTHVEVPPPTRPPPCCCSARRWPSSTPCAARVDAAFTSFP